MRSNKHILILPLAMLLLVSCEQPTAPEPDWWKVDKCSGESPYSYNRAKWSNLNPVFRFSRSLPESWRDYAEYAAASWNEVHSDLQIKVNKTVVSEEAALDGKNVVSYGSLPRTNRLGETYLWFNNSTGALIEADIRLNSDKPLSIGGSTSTYDVWSVLTHEFGHFCGLDHVNDRTHTMHPDLPFDSKIYRTLCNGDELGLRRLY